MLLCLPEIITLNELSCSSKSDGKLISLDQYISRMKSGQKDIFYITGSSKEQLEKSPFLERLKKKNYEVNFNWEFFFLFFFLPSIHTFPLISKIFSSPNRLSFSRIRLMST